MKPKENKGNKVGTYDECQTPPYALDPLFPYLNPLVTIWECAAGNRILSRALGNKGYNVFSTDINDYGNFFEIESTQKDYIIVTNPPYSIKYDWLERCFELDKPFALLLPVETIGSKRAQGMFKNKDVRIIFTTPRVDFLMKYSLWGGSGAQFPTAWFTWKLPLPRELNYIKLNKPKRKDLPEYWKKILGDREYISTIKKAEKNNIEYRTQNNQKIIDFYEYLGIERNE